MRNSISEILALCTKQSRPEDRARILQQHDTGALRAILQYALDPRVEWLLPQGEPPYKPTEHLDQHGNLIRDIRKINLFVKGGDHPTMASLKREVLFIQFIEALDPEDAKLMCLVKDKKLPYKNITASVVNMAFPGLVLVEEKKTK